MNNCSRCNNALITRSVFLGYIGPLCAPKYGEEEYCPYCEWKGDAGIGKQLKAIIAKHNEEIK